MLRSEQLQHFIEDFGSEEWPQMPAELRPGSISFHHSLTLHQSNANTSDKRRRGYAIHYMRTSSSYPNSERIFMK